MPNIAYAFGGVLGGALVIDYGVKHFKKAFSGNTSSTTGGTGTVTRSGLNKNQQAFAARLQADTNLSPTVINAWLRSEEPASATQAPNGANNWLNIGSYSSGNFTGGTNPDWANPTTAADATAAFIFGHSVNGVQPPGAASASIRQIASSFGKGIKAEAEAIISSDWAGSHYAGLPIASLA
jgi:hypothetical protein